MLTLIGILNLLIFLMLIFNYIKIGKKIVLKDDLRNLNNKLDSYFSDWLKEEDIKKYIEKSKEFKLAKNDLLARLALKNGFINNPGNANLFEKYISYLLEETASTRQLVKKKDYLDEAFNALFTFSEYAKLDDFNLVEEYQIKLEELTNTLNQKVKNETTGLNQNIFNQLKELINKLEVTDSESEIREILEEAAQLEEKLHFKVFTKEEHQLYKELQELFEDLATNKGEELNKDKYRKYNKRVIRKINNVFNEVSNNQKDYNKDKKDIVSLVKNSLATVNTEYLNTETMTYFNYVYNYIFGVISNDKKFELTKVMTAADKDLVR